MSDFHRTVMGHRFYEGTMPALVAELRRLNANLEKGATPMLTRREHTKLDRLLDQLNDAWAAYVANIVEHHGKPDPAFGIQVTEAKDNLLEYLKEIT